MFKKTENNLTKESLLDIKNYSDEELTSRNIKDTEIASSNLDTVPARIENEITYAHSPGGFLRASIYQNWVIIRQNELLSRQNEEIISLLKSNPSS